MIKTMLKIDNISGYYGSVEVLRPNGLSLSIKEGDRILLYGLNGAGKSTLLKAIVGLLPNMSGDIEWINDSEGNFTQWAPQQRILSGIGYLLQSKNIVNGLTVEENLQISGFGLPTKVYDERKDELLSIFCNIKDFLKKTAGNLSGGEKQSLAISMVLIKRPSLLLLDEPTAGLSPDISTKTIEYITSAQKYLGIKAICMIEHKTYLALPWATRVVSLVDGRLVHIQEDPQQFIEYPEKLESIHFDQKS